jgi:hypothetical protein
MALPTDTQEAIIETIVAYCTTSFRFRRQATPITDFESVVSSSWSRGLLPLWLPSNADYRLRICRLFQLVSWTIRCLRDIKQLTTNNNLSKNALNNKTADAKSKNPQCTILFQNINMSLMEESTHIHTFQTTTVTTKQNRNYLRNEKQIRLLYVSYI